MKGILAGSAVALFVAACGSTPTASSPPPSSGSKPIDQAALPATMCRLWPKSDVESITAQTLKEAENTSDRCSYIAGTDTYWPYELDIDTYNIDSVCSDVGGAPITGIGDRACESSSTLFDSSALTFSYRGRTFDISVKGDQDGQIKKALAKLVVKELKAR